MNNNVGIDTIKEQILNNNKKLSKVKQEDTSKIAGLSMALWQNPIKKMDSRKKTHATDQRKSDHSKNQFYKECKNIKKFVSKL